MFLTISIGKNKTPGITFSQRNCIDSEILQAVLLHTRAINLCLVVGKQSINESSSFVSRILDRPCLLSFIYEIVLIAENGVIRIEYDLVT